MLTTPRASSRIEGLDLLRGLAILLVILRHAWPDIFGGAGIVGVVAFFALSGYLITGLLVRDLDRYSRVRYGVFYMHRAIRLLPALIVVLIVFVIVDGVLNLTGERHLVPRSLLLSLTYTMNIPGLGQTNGALNHLWTLATEEQFYLAWPLVLACGLRYRKLRPAVIALGTFILLALAGSLLVVAPDYARIYAWPTTWAIAMVTGAAAQLERDGIARILQAGSRTTAATAAAGLTVILALSFIPDPKSTWWAYFVLGPVTSVATVALIFFLVHWRTIPWAPLRPLLWLGVISYAAYLWNKPAVDWLEATPLASWAPVLSIPVTVLLATASWFLVERPANRIRRKVDAGRKARERQLSLVSN